MRKVIVAALSATLALALAIPALARARRPKAPSLATPPSSRSWSRTLVATSTSCWPRC